MSSKRQTTMAKLQRERRVEERRTLKREKKQAAAAARRAGGQPMELTEEQLADLTDEQRALLADVPQQVDEQSPEPDSAHAREISATVDVEQS
jgi:hypothetical protein